MGMSVRWLNQDKTVIHHCTNGAWTWAEFYAIHYQVLKMMRSVEHEVSLITQFLDKDTLKMPEQLSRHAQNLFQNFPDNHGMTIFVGERIVLRTVIVTLSKVIPTNVTKSFKSVTTLADAYNLLSAPDEVLTVS